MKIYYGKAVYDQKEISASVRVLKNSMTLIDGPAVKELEKKVAKIFGKKYGLMVNSVRLQTYWVWQVMILKKDLR